MSAQPDFVGTASVVGFNPITAANTKSDGSGTIGTNLSLIATIGTKGSELEKVVVWGTATAAATPCAATTIRIYMCSIGSGSPTSANCVMIAEDQLPADTADHATTALNPHVIPIGMRIPGGYFILASIGTAAAASTAWVAIPFCRDYL